MSSRGKYIDQKDYYGVNHIEGSNNVFIEKHTKTHRTEGIRKSILHDRKVPYELRGPSCLLCAASNCTYSCSENYS